jgi:hypothetical protein
MHIKSIARMLVVCCCLLLLQACSAVKVTYNNAPALVTWWLNGYLDLNDAQHQALSPQLTTLQGWHREAELPVYIHLLETWQGQMRNDITPAQACEVFANVRTRMRVFNAHVEPVVLVLAPSLTAQQLNHLEKRFDKRNRKWRDEWMQSDLDERREYRLKQSVKRAETLYGKLNDTQKAMLKTSISTSSFDPQITYKEILRREQDALQVLSGIQKRPGDETRSKMEVQAYFDRLMQSPNALYRDNLETINRESCNTFAELHNSASPEQRAHATETLQHYINDLRLLHQQADKQHS